MTFGGGGVVKSTEAPGYLIGSNEYAIIELFATSSSGNLPTPQGSISLMYGPGLTIPSTVTINYNILPSSGAITLIYGYVTATVFST